MLDSDTKRRIDTARDILVGKLPDPKSQVEQITIALIYKFMDDMDAESEVLGGKRKFFAKDFARYGWAKLMRAGLGGQEVLNLYAEAISKMPENPGIPLLFRNIFRNAYLPYRDPETLKSFLKIIDDFTYDHSERLGDAFEYLLSVLGSQGDAGQFRTPRHIIDFIVDVVDPKKDETILDPACGTAGFLISSFKHIIRANSNDKGQSKLTPDEKGRLAKNLKGYDISPDMVRLSLVNLYLHGFTDPHIDEYDTLTSEDKWNETADIILANPPFMSPKGGIKPHRRFSVQSKRSEVLFVDYIAEHLSPTGRAGIIVPEGIIFQSQGAYTELRRMLVQNHLVAVISLPAGVFNPYSGVKTSILILDRSLARQSDTVGFFKVENDGFGLGAQRRDIDKNDLPQVRAELNTYFDALRNRHPTTDIPLIHGLIVPKEAIAANGDFNLGGERYRTAATDHNPFPFVRLGDVCERIMDGTHFSPKNSEKGEYRYITAKNIKQWGLALDDVTYLTKADHDEIYRRCPVRKGDVLYIKDGATAGIATINPLEEEFSLLSSVAVLRGREGVLDNRFLAHYLNSPLGKRYMLGMVSGVAITRLTLAKLNDAKITLPPLQVQKDIVAEIEGYQKVIDGARVVLDNYHPHIPIHPDWAKVGLGSLADNLDFRRVPITKSDRKQGPFPYYGASGIVDHVAGYIFDEDILLISEDGANLLARSTPIAFSVSGKCWVNNHAHVLKFANRATQKFVEVYLNSISIDEFVTGAAQPKLNQQALNRIPIPIPTDVTEQQKIVTEIETDQALVSANCELISRFDKRIQATFARVWGEEEAVTSEV